MQRFRSRYAHWYAHYLHGWDVPECYTHSAKWLIVLWGITPSQSVQLIDYWFVLGFEPVGREFESLRARQTLLWAVDSRASS